VGAVFVAAPASAHAGVRITNVDVSVVPSIRLTVVTSTPSSRPPAVTQNGAPVVGLSTQNLGLAKNVVLAIDHSRSMRGRPLADALAAARRFVALKPGSDQIAVVSFASQTVLESGFSASAIDAAAALGSIGVDGVYGTRLYDAIVQSAQALRRAKVPGRVIVLVTDGNETTSKATLDQAIRAARAARASVYPVAIDSGDFSPAPLRRLARRTGGSFYTVRSSKALKGIYARISRELRRTWRIEYVAAAVPGDRLRLRVTVPRLGAASATARLGGTELQPGTAWSRASLWLALALGAGVAGLIAFGLLGAARARIRWPGLGDDF
jgi:VWFA-related protein